MSTPDFLKDMSAHLTEKRASMNHQIRSTQLIKNRKRAIDRDDIEALPQINSRLWDLTPATENTSEEMRAYAGIL